MLANPVAFDFDEKGRLFVSETYRYRSSVLDIRDYMGMLELDLAARTIEDRVALHHKVFGAQAKDFAIESEVVRLVEDTDGDGVADKSRVFADGFNTELDGIASGVLARHGKVWFTNIPSLWLLEEGADGKVKKDELLRGFGVRYNFTGHDFHGLAHGPRRQDLLLDRRSRHAREGQGRPGRRLSRMKARCSAPIPMARSSSSWRAACAIRRSWCSTNTATSSPATTTATRATWSAWCTSSKAATAAGASATSTRRSARAARGCAKACGSRAFAGRPAYLLPPVCNIEDGPSGLTYYPGTGLDPKYAGHFFITHFKGSIARSGIQTYTLKQNGATFAPTSSQQFMGGVLPTDVTFGPDGKLYISRLGRWLAEVATRAASTASRR